MTAWIDTLTANGWTVVPAFGDAAAEQARLDDLQAVQEVAPTVDELADMVGRLRSAFDLGRDPVSKERLATALAATHAVEQLSADVEAAQAAVTAAEQMPTVYHLSRDGVSLYVADTDTEQIAALTAAP